MVLPLKLTQFYGNEVPRPRIYADVKFGDRRVDPPPSINEALLSWATDAHWSMGGLSFKRLRSHGKFEGSARRLKTFIDDEERHGEKNIHRAKAETTSMKEVSGPIQKKGQHAADESSLATPVRKTNSKVFGTERNVSGTEVGDGGSSWLGPPTVHTPMRRSKRKNADVEENDGGSPLFVPATVEKQQENLRSKDGALPLVPAMARGEKQRTTRRGSSVSDASVGPSSPLVKKMVEASASKTYNGFFETPEAKSEPGKAKFSTSLDNVSHSAKGLELSNGRRGFRSAIKAVNEGSQASSPTSMQKKSRAKKLILRSSDDNGSSESDDGLEAFLNQKGRPVRRSTRMVKQSKPQLPSSDSEADSG